MAGIHRQVAEEAARLGPRRTSGGGPPGRTPDTPHQFREPRARRCCRRADRIRRGCGRRRTQEVHLSRMGRHPQAIPARLVHRSGNRAEVRPAASGTIDDAPRGGPPARPARARFAPPPSAGSGRRRIDIDAAVERLEVRAGSVPDEAVYLDSLRRRRDLSVLLLLDVSGSGRTRSLQPHGARAAAHGRRGADGGAGTTSGTGWRCSPTTRRGRRLTSCPSSDSAKPLGSVVLRRLNSLEPGGYS